MFWDFIKRNWIIILVGIASLTAGFLLNVYANSQSEKRIIKAIMDQINEIKQKQAAGGRLSSDEQNKLIGLEAQLKLLTA